MVFGRFGVRLDPDKEVVMLIGSKEGIAHLPWAYLHEGDVALIPSPGYPVYKITTLIAGGTPLHHASQGRERVSAGLREPFLRK